MCSGDDGGGVRVRVGSDVCSSDGGHGVYVRVMRGV